MENYAIYLQTSRLFYSLLTTAVLKVSGRDRTGLSEYPYTNTNKAYEVNGFPG